MQAFSVTPLAPVSYDLQIQWYLDASPIAGANQDSYEIKTSELTFGMHQLSVEVSDTTSFVLSDPYNLLLGQHVWTIDIQAGDSDGDGFTDDVDNCPTDYNLDQADEDGDNIGDLCDLYCCADAGDSDDNVIVNLLDITFIIDYLYKGGPPPACYYQSDANTNTVVNILDIAYLIAFLYQGGPVPNCL